MPAPKHIWTRQFGSPGGDTITDSVLDHSGNIIVCGYTEGQLTEAPAHGNGDTFLAKYDSSGNQLWIHQLGSSAYDSASGVDVDRHGNIFVFGNTLGDMVTGEAIEKVAVFLAKYDSDGARIWFHQWEDTDQSDTAYSICIDSDSDIYLAGSSFNMLEADPFLRNSALLTKLAPNGNFIRSIKVTTGSSAIARSVTTDQENNVYVCGYTEGQLTEAPAHGNEDAFLAKYDTDVNQQWTIQLGTTGYDFASDLATDRFGNIFICGTTTGELQTDQATGSYDAYLAKYDTKNGEQLWIRQIKSNTADFGLKITIDQSGNIFFCGQTDGGLGTAQSFGRDDVFVTKYDSDGNQLWIEQTGTAGQEESRAGIIVDNSGHFFICGTTTGEMEPGTPINGTRTINPFIAKYQDAAHGKLLIPLNLQGLYVNKPTNTVGPSTDFSYLPWNDGRRDYNPDFAPLGEHVTTTPLESANGELQPGIHLHWSLPHGLATAIEKADGSTVLPYAPVKWDVVPIELTGSPDFPARTVWSDAMWPEDTPINQDKAIVPVPYRRGHAPYRYLGRTTDLGDQPPSPLPGENQVEYFSGSNYLDRPFDVLGHGSLHFAPFYPNCRGVFGHYQPLEGNELANNPCYFVSTKLYQSGDGNDDLPINKLIKDTGLTLAEILDQMEWPRNDAGGTPTEITLAGAVKIDLDSSPEGPLQHTPGDISFALGNTGNEALSALLANKVARFAGNRGKLEEQLEAILMHDKISGSSADLGLQFLEQRHRQSFEKLSGGTQWRLQFSKREKIMTHLANVNQTVARRFITAVERLDEALISLNRAQRDYDKFQEKIDSEREVLFADWYKYMSTKYPAPESLEVFESAPYPQIGEAGAWVQHRAEKLRSVLRELELRAPFINKNVDRVEQLIRKLESLAETADFAELILLPNFEINLTSQPAQPYYRAKDPVVLIEGLDIEEPRLEQAAAGAEHYAYDLELDGDSPTEQANKIFEHLFTSVDNVSTTEGWNPFILEWEVEFLPALSSFGDKAIHKNFELGENEPEARVKENKDYSNTATATLRGRTFLSPGAKLRKQKVLTDFLGQKLAGDEPVSEDALPDLIQAYIDNHAATTGENDAILTAAHAYQQLKEMTVLSQALGGFTTGTIQLENYEQPALGDPLGTEPEQAFSSIIGQLVGRAAKYGPNAANPFSPVRSGTFKLVGLRIVDTWGRYRDLLKEQDFVPIIAQPLRAAADQPAKPEMATLPLRLSQPLRLHFNWHSATSPISESAIPGIMTSELPVASPILGWLSSNHLAQNLQCYTADGRAIGYYNREAEALLPAPGNDDLPDLDGSPSTMKQIFARIEGQPGYLRNFLSATNAALDQIAPHESELHANVAMLTERPIGVARVKLQFDLKGMAAQKHDWDTFKEQIKNLQRGKTEVNSHWEKMKFPVRLGNYAKLNDGLIGFWEEDNKGMIQGPLYTMGDQPDSETILSHNADRTIWLPLDGTAVNLTVLFDPRGSIHATTGALPVQSVKLDHAHFSQVINRMSSWFMSAPLLQPAGLDDKLLASLPPEPGYQWSWLEKQQDTDTSWRATTTFNDSSERATLQSKLVLKEGWFKISHDND